LSHHSAGSVSVFSFLTPVVAVFFANWLRGDQLTGSLLLCGLGVAAGIALVNWPERETS
jgi:drug/metabolite transporter (DMT)-like permease